MRVRGLYEACGARNGVHPKQPKKPTKPTGVNGDYWVLTGTREVVGTTSRTCRGHEPWRFLGACEKPVGCVGDSGPTHLREAAKADMPKIPAGALGYIKGVGTTS